MADQSEIRNNFKQEVETKKLPIGFIFQDEKVNFMIRYGNTRVVKKFKTVMQKI